MSHSIKPLYVHLASTLAALRNCEQSGNTEWREVWHDTIEGFCRACLPHGSGFDSGSVFDMDKSTPDRLVIKADFHHMNDGGFYDGWTEHEVIVTASLAFGFEIRITGRDRRGIKDYISDTFNHALSEPVDIEPLITEARRVINAVQDESQESAINAAVARGSEPACDAGQA